MVKIDGVKISAVVGVVPSNRFDVAEVCGREIVKTAGFSSQRRASAAASLFDFFVSAGKKALEGVDAASIGAVVAVTFSSARRYPSVSQSLQSALGLPSDIVALDLSVACSGYPSGLMTAMQLVRSTGKSALLLDGDFQSRYLGEGDVKSAAVMGDGVSATLITSGDCGAVFDFLVDGGKSAALVCDERIAMKGFEVFQFVMGEVRDFAARFLADNGSDGILVPHQANLYMVRQLAGALGVPGERVAISGDRFGNPGSASIPVTISANEVKGTVTLIGFGAGLSAAAVRTEIPADCRFSIMEI